MATLRLSFLLIALSAYFVSINFAHGHKADQKIKKSNELRHYSLFNINNISTFIYNNGEADLELSNDSGFEFPKGSRKKVVFQSGFIFGGKINEEIRVGGSNYNSGLTPGKILPSRNAEDPLEQNVRVFRVRQDYLTADFSLEVERTGKTEEEIRLQYQLDWFEWPANDGAPFEDKNSDGQYNPLTDIPGITSASQTLWFVANDLDSNQTKTLFGSLPLGIELQVTCWGYDQLSPEDNILFKKYVLINKSDYNIDSMFVSMWVDPDVGGASDDFVGCDSLLNLGYAYNADDDDTQYGENVPAVGFTLLQGPVIDGKSNDFAIQSGKRINGKQNLPMTSFLRLLKGSAEFGDPALGSYENGSLVYWNYGHSRDAFGNTIINPISEEPTSYTVSGDPEAKIGWIDGLAWSPGDRRMMLASGSFEMSPADTQEVIFAQIAAGGDLHVDRFEAIQLLKSYSEAARELYKKNFTPLQIVKSPKVEILELDEEIVLSWYNNSMDSIEAVNKFQGYTIYQYKDQSFSNDDRKEFQTFDINDGITKISVQSFDTEDESILFELVKNGSDSGIKRHISITKDLFNSSLPLNNGSRYFYGISAYAASITENQSIRLIESKPTAIIAIPQSAKPGNYYEAKYGDSINVYSENENTNVKITVRVVDPTVLSGKQYEIEFYQHSSGDNWNDLFWRLSDYEQNILLTDMELHLPNILGNSNSIVADGFEIEPFKIDTLNENPISDGDKFYFTTPSSKTGDLDLATKQTERINIFPNPYYGKQGIEQNQYQKFVTINHLPQKANIKIFNLSGHLIKTIKKDNNSQFVYWNMLNENNFYVASGLYIIHIDMPDLNKHKILKLAVILENIVFR